MNHVANGRELAGRVAVVTGVTRRAGIGAAIAQELAAAGAKVFVAFFRKYDQRQRWGLEPRETDALLDELRAPMEFTDPEAEDTRRLRYRNTNLCINVLTTISKRVEDGEPVDVRELFNGMQAALQDAILDMGGTA